MTTGAITGQTSLSALPLNQEVKKTGEEAPAETGQPVADTAQISGEAKPEKPGMGGKIKNWLKNKMNQPAHEPTTADTIKKVILSTASGAVTGAAMVALVAAGNAPVICAVAGAIVGGVALGLTGAFGGFFTGMFSEKAGNHGAWDKHVTRGGLGGLALGAAAGGASGWVRGHMLTALVTGLSITPGGGAIAGAAISCAAALTGPIVKYIGKKLKHHNHQDTGIPAPQQQPPQQPVQQEVLTQKPPQ